MNSKPFYLLKLTKKSFYSIFLPISLFTFFITLFTLFFIYDEKKKSIEGSHLREAQMAQYDFTETLKEQSEAIAMVVATIADDTDVHKSLQNLDAQNLLHKYEKTFEKLKHNNSITHLYFLDKNRQTLLRVHAPNKSGDHIDRFTARDAEWKRALSYGLELGMLGTLTLRVITPVFEENEIIGYVEVGKEIEDVLKKISKKHHFELLLLIHKNHLSQSLWESGMQMLHRDSNWKKLENFVLMFSTLQKLDENLTQRLNSSVKIDQLKIEDKIFTHHVEAIKDVSSKEIGQLVFFKDMTNDIQNRQIFSTTLLVLGLGSMMVFILLIYAILRKSEQNSELKNVEILKNEERIEELQKQTRVIVWEVDSKGLYTFVSDSVYEILGYRAEELMFEKYFYDLHPQENKKAFAQSVFEIFSEKTPLNALLNPVMNINKEVVWMSTNAIPILDEEGELLGYRGSDRDVTLELAKENIAVQRNNLFKRVINSIPQRVFWKDLDLHYLGCNDAFAKDSGNLSPEDLIGKDDYEMVWTEHAKEYRIADKKVILSGEPKLFYEEDIKTADGDTRWISTSKIPLLDNDGKIMGVIGIYEDFTDKKIVEDKIHKLAFYDTLTSLANRTLLLEMLKKVMADSVHSHNYCALIFIDLDNFKTLNDTLGHKVGDMLLQEVAKRLKTFAHDESSLARLGGDEFVLILKDLSTDSVQAKNKSMQIASKILSSLQKEYTLEWAKYKSSASIGITLFSGEEVSIDNLMKQADLAMYNSKEEGRNSVSFFEPSMETSLKERAEMEDDLRGAIEREEFVLLYQAQMNSTHQVIGAEALVRWMHPQKGLISPLVFIPIAEESDLILKLGDWILKSATQELHRWSKLEKMANITLAINVSVKQFSQNNFVKNLLSIIEKSHANPKMIKLEITESMLVEDKQGIIEKMSKLKKIGIRFSLDDFGTGYSSLSYLKQLPIDQLKIDQSFVQDILTDKNDKLICKSTIAIASSMGLNVIAEGVEQVEQKEMLESLGCLTYQGYLFSKPITSREFETFVGSM